MYTNTYTATGTALYTNVYKLSKLFLEIFIAKNNSFTVSASNENWRHEIKCMHINNVKVNLVRVATYNRYIIV